MSDQTTTSTRPYLIRALHEWCTDNGLTPYIAAHVDGRVRVPTEYVKDSEIVLNVSYDATSSLTLGNEFVEFRARFGGVARDIVIPVEHVVAIYARENGQGMAFPPPAPADAAQPSAANGAQRVDDVESQGDAGQTGDDDHAASTDAGASSPVQLVVASSDRGKSAGKTAGKTKTGKADLQSVEAADSSSSSVDDDEPSPPSPPAGRPALKRVK